MSETERAALAAKLKVEYEQGASLLALGKSIGRSEGFVRRLFVEARVPIRPRGGDSVRMRAAARKSWENTTDRAGRMGPAWEARKRKRPVRP